jgi:hypothetical protein
MTRSQFVRKAALTIVVVAAWQTGSGCGNPTIAAPRSFAKFSSKDGSFSCEYPEGWHAESGNRSDNTYSWAEFVSGPARIRIDADVSGSLMADIAKAGMGGMNNAEVESPVAIVHEQNKKNVAEGYGVYKEGAAQKVTTLMGEGQQADFTASGSMLGSHLHGQRTTILSSNLRVTVLCQCPAPQWKKLKPTFDRVIQSMKR